MNIRTFVLPVFLLISGFASSQQFLQGVLYAKLKANSELVSKSPLPSTLNITQWGHISPKTTLRKRSSSPISHSGIERVIKIYYSSRHTPSEAAELLMKTGLYEYVEPSPIFSPLYVPNDPYADSTFANPAAGQTQLFTHTFWQAWNIEKGDTNVVIAIVDNGINFKHEDLQSNMKINYNDPENGINEDSNWYFSPQYQLTDDYRGWDVADWDNNPTLSGNGVHGTHVTSIAAATPDNGVGIAGTGFNSKYVHYKVAPDTNFNLYTTGYDGAIIAGQSGAKVINLSWGSLLGNLTTPQILVDVINYLVYDLDVVVIGAAGNSKKKETWFPAAIPAAISVTGITVENKKQDISTFDYTVDIAACGSNVQAAIGTKTNDYTNKLNGTSFAAPVIAGAAALVRSRYPTMKAIQVNQLLRVTGDIIDTIGYNLPYQYMMGRKLNPYRALTEMPPAFRLTDYDSTISVATNGAVVSLPISVINHLTSSSSNSTARLINLNSSIVLLDSIISIGAVNSQEILPPNELFSFGIPAFDDTLVLEFVIEYTDDNMIDFEYIQVTILPDLLTTTNTEELERNFSMSPNPTRNKVNIQFISPIHVEQYQLTDAMGKTILQSNVNKLEQNLVIDIPETPKGVYFLTLKTENNFITKKLIIY